METGFSWARWSLHLDMLAGVVLASIVYALAVGPLAPRIRQTGNRRPERSEGGKRETAVTRGQVASFAGAMLVLVFALNGPLHDLSDYYLFSAHMGQHLLLTLAMPPLLLRGIPDWLAEAALRSRPAVLAAARRLTHPVVAGLIPAAVVAAWHFPGPYDLLMRNHDVHVVMHLMIMATAVLMWWPVASPTALVPPLNPGGQMLYLFLLGIPMSGVGAFITLAEAPLYRWYAGAPRVFALSPHDDQVIGGLAMWVLGTLVFWVAMTVIWFRWAGREEREEAL